MHPILLGLHSWIRWILVADILILLFRSFMGYRKGSEYGPIDQGLAMAVLWTLNIQFLLGIALYVFFSPVTQAAFSNMSAAMSDSSLRFYIVEHVLAMLLAIGAGHVGLSKVKKESDPKKKHGLTLKWVGLCLFCIIVGIPWPFLPYGRALFFL